jgi:hypothetical protein
MEALLTVPEVAPKARMSEQGLRAIREGQFPAIRRRAEIITIHTAPARTNQHNPLARKCDCCNRQAPRLVRYVERLGGGCSDACRSCFLRLTANEARNALVARWDALFRRLCPWVFGLRGAGQEVAYA